MSSAAALAALNQARGRRRPRRPATAAWQPGRANAATTGQFAVETLKAAAPLIAAAFGVPLPAAPGGTNISNAAQQPRTKQRRSMPLERPHPAEQAVATLRHRPGPGTTRRDLQ